jgi:hypothetical protein
MTRSAGPRQWECQEARIALGAYVLGALDPAEQALVEAHLDRCDACLTEMAELADLPALLDLVPAEEAVRILEAGEVPAAPEAPAAGNVVSITEARAPQRAPASEDNRGSGEPRGPEAKREGLAGVAGRADRTPGESGGSGGIGVYPPGRASRRGVGVYPPGKQWLTVAAAAVVIGAASYGGVRLAASPAAPAPAAAQDPHAVVGPPLGTWLTGAGSAGAVTGTVAYRQMGWGTQLAAKVTGIALNTPCQLWVVESNGTRVQAGSWDTDSNEGSVWYPGSAEVAATTIKSFVITVGNHQPVTVAVS